MYPVDIAGVRLNDTGQLESAHRGREALDAIAKGSGGQVIQTADVLNEAVERIREHASLDVRAVIPAEQESRGPADTTS